MNSSPPSPKHQSLLPKRSSFLFLPILLTPLLLLLQSPNPSLPVSNQTLLLSMLRRSVTFLPLKDIRLSANSFFISSLPDPPVSSGEPSYILFPPPSSDHRLLCLSASDTRDGSRNSYALAFPQALPHNSTFLPGLTFVSETFYDHTNLWHALAAILPFARWHAQNGCSRRKDGSGLLIWRFERECGKVEGCRVRWLRSADLAFCDQVKAMSETDILVSPHGAQMTNMIFMDENSSVMEFFPKGWLELAGAGQYVFRWLADSAGMKHRGQWRDPNGEICPFEDKAQCFTFYKDGAIGHDEAFFSHWAAKVLEEAKLQKLKEASLALKRSNKQSRDATDFNGCCSCG